MKRITVFIVLLVVTAVGGYAQQSSFKKTKLDTIYARGFNPDTCVKTDHHITINGKLISYSVTTGLLPVYKENQVTAGLSFTYYKRNNIKNMAQRPIMFFFNGGPGSSSIWLHMGYAGPRIAKLDNEGYFILPEGLEDNHNSLLDVADLVFVDPAGTGYSQGVGSFNSLPSYLYTENGDSRYLSEWIVSFLNRFERWLSPKYIAGESYGGRRVAAMAGKLDSLNVSLNGVVLISSSPLNSSHGNSKAILDNSFFLTDYTRMAWHKQTLDPSLQSEDLQTVIDKADIFFRGEYLPAIFKVGALTAAQRKQLAQKAALFTSLPVQLILENNFNLDTAIFKGMLTPSNPGSGNYYTKQNRGFVDVLFSVYHFAHAAMIAKYYHFLAPEYQKIAIGPFFDKVLYFSSAQLLPFLAADSAKKTLSEKVSILKEMSDLTGLSVTQLDNANLQAMPVMQKKLQSCGFGDVYGMDIRYNTATAGSDIKQLSMAFYPAFLNYVKTELNFRINNQYDNHFPGFRMSYMSKRPETYLWYALNNNPYLNVLCQIGYYDGNTTPLHQSLNAWELDPSGRFADRIHRKYYEAGHMFYAKKSERNKGIDDLREFIRETMQSTTTGKRLEPLN